MRLKITNHLLALKDFGDVTKNRLEISDTESKGIAENDVKSDTEIASTAIESDQKQNISSGAMSIQVSASMGHSCIYLIDDASHENPKALCLSFGLEASMTKAPNDMVVDAEIQRLRGYRTGNDLQELPVTKDDFLKPVDAKAWIMMPQKLVKDAETERARLPWSTITFSPV